jgi:hypothetical protein
MPKSTTYCIFKFNSFKPVLSFLFKGLREELSNYIFETENLCTITAMFGLNLLRVQRRVSNDF